MSPSSRWQCRVSSPAIVQWTSVNGWGVGHYCYLSRLKRGVESTVLKESKNICVNQI